MPGLRRSWMAVATLSLLMASAGCQMFPDSLQMHQLWKLNRNPAPTSDPFFSVPDPIEGTISTERDSAPK